MMAQSASRRLWQLLSIRPVVTTFKAVSRRNLTTVHAGPLLNAGCDLESPDVIYGSRSWRWLRPATPVEIELDDWHQYKSRMSMPMLTINADREITEDMWRQMLKHLSNQIPCLRMLILPREEEKWICDVEDMDISFKMYEDMVPLDFFDKVLDEFVNENPLVFKVIKASKDDVCLFPEDKRSKPFQYYLVSTVHHALVDGYSGLLMIRQIMNNLNLLLAGKSVEDTTPVTHASKGDEIISKKAKLKEAFINDKQRFNIEKERFLSTIKTPLIREAFPAPNVSIVKSGTVLRKPDKVVFNAFQERCKSAGVSVTNGLIAAVNVAFVEMVREAGILRESYNLTLSTTVNLRRYMNNHPQTATGMLVQGMHQSMHPTQNVRKEFWEHAKAIHDDAKILLKKDGALVESVIREMTLPKLDPLTIFKYPNSFTYDSDYVFNNLLDITPFLYDMKKHKHAVITDGVVLNSNHNFKPMNLTLSTYRGILQFTLNYANNYLSHETAEELLERIDYIMRDKSEIIK